MITMAFTRPQRRLDESVREAESFGFKVLAAPSLDIVHGDSRSYRDIWEKLSRDAFGTVIFSSATAAEECLQEWGDGMPELLKGAEVIAIGPGTSGKLERMGVKVSSIPDEYTSSGLVEHLGMNRDGRNVLIVHSDRGSSILKDGLTDAGFVTEELIAYTLEKHDGGLDRIRFAILDDSLDVIAFTSRMSVESFLDSIGLEKGMVFGGVRVAAIGGPTKERLEDEGIHVDILPEKATFRGLLQAIKDYFGQRGIE